MQYGASRHSFIAALVVTGLLLSAACDLNPANENNPTEEEVLSTAEGIRTLTVGMQEFYATDALNATIPRAMGITSREIAINNTFSNLIEMEAGGTDLPTSNVNIESMWSTNYRVVSMAENVLANAPDVNLTAETRSGIVATARLFKAMALGNIALAFEQAPMTTSRDGTAEFVPRQQVLQEAITLLDDALSRLDSTAPSDDFRNNILATGLSLRNTIHAYRARFHLLAGNDQDAIDAANQVDPTVASQFNYDDQSQNPFWQEFIRSGDLAPRDSLGTRLTEPGDSLRLNFFTNPEDALSTPNELPIEGPDGFYTSASSPFPLYVPGELPLIRAEAKLSMNGATQEVVDEIDRVRTDSLGSDDIPSPFGIAAELSPYNGPMTEEALRTEILRQRRAELYLLGTGLADNRRLGPEVNNRQDPGPFERSRNFYPYPDQERRNNPNTPESPEF